MKRQRAGTHGADGASGCRTAQARGWRKCYEDYGLGTPHLINYDHLIVGSGIIGSYAAAEPPPLLFTNHGTVRARAGDQLQIVSDATHVFTNHGQLDVQRGGALTVHGPLVQTAW